MLKKLFINLPAVLIVVALAGTMTYARVNPKPFVGAWNAVLSAVFLPSDKQAEVETVQPEPRQAEEKPAEVKEEPQAPAARTATIRNEVNLRASRSTEAQILAVIPQGAIVTLAAEEDASWQAIEYQGVSGYVAKSYLIY